MSDITWGVCSDERTVTVYCLGCYTVIGLPAPMIKAQELKRAAQASHTCPPAPDPDCN